FAMVHNLEGRELGRGPLSNHPDQLAALGPGAWAHQLRRSRATKARRARAYGRTAGRACGPAKRRRVAHDAISGEGLDEHAGLDHRRRRAKIACLVAWTVSGKPRGRW